jgi:arylsulfatase A-like enzyme
MRKLIHLTALLLAPLAALQAAETATAKPNVIIVMPDDVSHSVFTYYNPRSESKTPNIDKLMENSVRLTDFHVSPTCAPTRAALLTGRFNDVTGVWHTIFGRSQLRADEITMADVLKHNGYATGMFFK